MSHPVMRGEGTYQEPTAPVAPIPADITQTAAPAAPQTPVAPTPPQPQGVPATPAQVAEPTQTPAPAQPTAAPQADGTAYQNIAIPTPRYATQTAAAAAHVSNNVGVAQTAPPAQANSALEQQLNQMQEMLTQQQQQTEQLRRQQEQEALFQRSDFTGLNHIPEEQAAEIFDDVLAPALRRVHEHATQTFADQTTQMQEQLTSMRNQLGGQVDEVSRNQQQYAQQRREHTNSVILQADPNFESNMSDPQFMAAASAVIPGTNTSYMQELQQAYQADDAQQVIAVSQYIASQAGTTPPVVPVESGLASATQPAGTQPIATAPGGATQYTYEDMDTMIHSYKQGTISRPEYLKFKAEFDAQERAQNAA